MINFRVRKVCHQFMDLMQRKAMKMPANGYEWRMREKKGLYDKIQKLLDGERVNI
jgi:hypothetical protein